MYEILVGIIFAAFFVGFYLTVKTLMKRGDDGRSRWRNLITPTPVDALSTKHQLRAVNQLPSHYETSASRKENR